MFIELDPFSTVSLVYFPFCAQLNPQHTVPVLDDNGVVIADSHAMCAYFCEKYGKNDKLYPQDLAKRALVDSRLHFDCGYLFARMRFMFEPVFFLKFREIPEDRKHFVRTAYDIWNRLLKRTLFVAGDDMAIADLCLSSTIVSVTDIIPLDPAKHSKITEWIGHMSKLPYFESNVTGKDIQDAVRRHLKKNAESE